MIFPLNNQLKSDGKTTSHGFLKHPMYPLFIIIIVNYVYLLICQMSIFWEYHLITLYQQWIRVNFLLALLTLYEILMATIDKSVV